MSYFKKGFTLIELLVVIAIIGILSSVVLASLNTARTKGNDAAIKANLNGIRSQAELWFDGNSNSYSGVCGDTNITNAIAAANSAGGAGAAQCFNNSSTTAWVVTAKLRSVSGYWCVDYTGNSKEVAAGATSSTDYICN